MGLKHFLRGTTPESEVFVQLVKLTTELETAITLTELESRELQRQVAIKTLHVVSNVTLSMQSVRTLLQRMEESRSEPARYLWNSISSAFILAVVVEFEAGLKYGERVKRSAALHQQLARMEGTLLGFIERQGLIGWKPSYLDFRGSYVMAFENARQRCSDGKPRHMVES
jgi:hypothetical protein